MKILKIILILLIINSVIGCTDDYIPTGKSSIEGKIRILYSDEQSFMDAWGNLFKFYYPNISFEIVQNSPIANNIQNLDLEENKHNLDVLFLNTDDYRNLSRSGLLENIESRILNGDEGIKYQEFVEPIVNLLRNEGGGSIYGLAPFFHSRVLYFNQDLFDQYGVPYPTDNMNWEEVLETATQFPAKGSVTNGHYGFYYPFTSDGFNPFRLVNVLAQSENSTFIDLKNNRITLNNTRYEDLLNMIIQGLLVEAIYKPTDTAKEDQFLLGNAAMRYEGYFYLKTISTSSFNWNMRSEPIGYNATVNYIVDDIFSIPIKSPNKEIAWEFVKFVNSERFLRIKARSMNDYGIPVRQQIISDMLNSEKNLEAFYKLSPIIRGEDTREPSVHIDIQSITQKESNKILEGSSTVDESIRAIEHNMQIQLDEKGDIKP